MMPWARNALSIFSRRCRPPSSRSNIPSNLAGYSARRRTNMGAPVTQPRALRFLAMGCPCEVLLDTDDSTVVSRLEAIALEEARRVETKFSRYRDDSVVSRLNAGGRVEVDEETAGLLDFAARCWDLSGGLFDI